MSRIIITVKCRSLGAMDLRDEQIEIGRKTPMRLKRQPSQDLSLQTRYQLIYFRHQQHMYEWSSIL